MPLTTTDTRHAYRSLDAALKHATRLRSYIEASDKPSKTLFSRCYSLADSLGKKLNRTVVVLRGHSGVASLLEKVQTLSTTCYSRVNFPPRFVTDQSSILKELTSQSVQIEFECKAILTELGEALAQTKSKAPAPPRPDDDSNQDMFVKFLDGISGKWRVQRSQGTPCECSEDPFGEGCKLLTSLSAPYQQLLPDDAELGVVPFPIILLEAYRLPETTFKEFSGPIHKVFGTYVVLRNIFLMGVHQDLMKSQEEDVDAARFLYLLPYLKRNIPRAAEKIKGTVPSGPPRFARSHYYIPLLPSRLLKTPNFSLGKWSFLMARNGE